ncbi:MAG: class I SAM-dependent methyltransferase, partial [Candidatus Odinarchaeota archaeon]
MRKLFYFDNNPRCTLWDNMWTTRTIEEEIAATEIETAPRVMFLHYIPKNGKIIDGGCGFGKWVIFLNKHGYDIIGVDNNQLSIQKLKEYDNSLNVEYGDILKLNYPDNFFDAYISMGVVEHFEEGPLKALNEAYRVLKPNGLIFLSTPTVNIIRKIIIQPIQNIINKFQGIIKKVIFYHLGINDKNEIFVLDRSGRGNKKKYYHFAEYRFSIKELHNFLKKSNFQVVQTVPHDFHGSKDHAIGLAVDFPFLKAPYSTNFKLNPFGKLLSQILEKISPWISCASVLCVGKALKNEN